MILNLLTILLSVFAPIQASIPEPALAEASQLVVQDDLDPPDPAGGSFDVEINGQPSPADMFFMDNGTWVMVANGNVVGWGVYTFDGTVIEYLNLSPDGGGGQSGVYSWTGDKWRRTWTSHPKAPPLSLVPMP